MTSRISLHQALSKAMRYCAYRERCTSEVYDKLSAMQVAEDDIRQVIHELQDAGFLDDRRYAHLFVRSKFSNNRWGRRKIRFMLKQKKVDEEQVSAAMKEIDDKAYRQNLASLVTGYKKNHAGQDNNRMKRNLYRYLVTKGYEPGLVRDMIQEIS